MILGDPINVVVSCVYSRETFAPGIAGVHASILFKRIAPTKEKPVVADVAAIKMAARFCADTCELMLAVAMYRRIFVNLRLA